MVLFTEKEIQTRVKSLALEVSYKNNLKNSSRVMIGVLNGAFMFFADLVRNLEVDCEIDFMQAKSYLGQVQDRVDILKDVSIDLKDKDIFIVDDIYDSGNTMKRLVAHLQTKGAKSITPVTLFKRSFSNMDGLMYGFELHNEAWLVGTALMQPTDIKETSPSSPDT